MKRLLASVLLVGTLSGCHPATLPVPQARPHPGVSALMRLAPYDTQGLVALDIRDRVSLVDEVGRLRQQATSDAGLAKGLTQFEHDLGLSPESLARWAQPAVLAVAFPQQEGSPLYDSGNPADPEGGLILAVNNETEAKIALLQMWQAMKHDSGHILQHPATPVPVELEGTPCWLTVAGDGVWATAIDHGYLFIAPDVRSLRRLLRTAHGADRCLADNPEFSDAARLLPLTDGAFSYVALRPSLGTILRGPHAREDFDQVTLDAVHGIRYVAGQLSPDDDGLSGEFCLKVDPTSRDPFIRAIVDPLSGELGAVNYVPHDSHEVFGLDFAYWYRLGTAAARLDVQYRKYEDEQKSPHDPFTVQQFLQAVNGPVVLSSDFLENYEKDEARRVPFDLYSECQSHCMSIETDLLHYRQKHALYPPTLSGPGRDLVCPVSGRHYVYRTNGQSFDLYCPGDAHKAAGAHPDEPHRRFGPEGRLQRDIQSLTAPSTPSGVLLIFPCRSPDAVAQLWTGLKDKIFDAEVEDHVVGQVAGVDLHQRSLGAHGWSAGGICWAQAKSPCPALLVGGGDTGLARLKAALTCAATGTSATADPLYERTLKDVSGHSVVGVDMVGGTWMEGGDFNPFRGEREGYAALLEGIFKRIVLRSQRTGVSMARLDPDGVHLVSHGGGSALVAGAATTGMLWEFTSYRYTAYGMEFTAASCEHHEQQLAGALDLYAAQHQGKYPGTLKELVPQYLTRVPTCSRTLVDTYSAGYHATPDGYVLHCQGKHDDSLAGYPTISSKDGVRLAP